jgi:hypothetical protein
VDSVCFLKFENCVNVIVRWIYSRSFRVKFCSKFCNKNKTFCDGWLDRHRSQDENVEAPEGGEVRVKHRLPALGKSDGNQPLKICLFLTTCLMCLINWIWKFVCFWPRFWPLVLWSYGHLGYLWCLDPMSLWSIESNFETGGCPFYCPPIGEYIYY